MILARMSRQRCACSRRVLRSDGEMVVAVRPDLFQLARNQEDRRQRRAEFMGGGGGKAVELGQMLLARQHQFGRGQRIGKLARLLGDLERIEAGDADREHDREPDAEQIDRRQHQRVVAVPRQRQMEEHQRRGAGDREHAERDRQPDRQHRRRDQDRGEEQERERVLQAPGEEQQRGQFDDVEREQRRRIDRLQPLHRVEGDLQREIEQRRKADDGDAGNDGNVEFQPLRHDEDRGELAERRQPAQPQDRIQTDIAVRMAEIGGGDVGHCREFSRAGARSQIRGIGQGVTPAAVQVLTGQASCSSRRRDGPMNGPKWSIATPRQHNRPRPVRKSSAAIDVAHLIKLYKTTRAVDDVSFRIARGSITGLLGGNGAGKTTTIAMIMGLVLPTSGRIQVLGHPMPEQSAEVLGRMNFESPYVDMPMRLTVRQNLTIFGRLYAVKNLRRAHRTARRRPRSQRFPRPRQRQTLGRAEDPRRAGEGADQPAGAVAARRADGFARSRYRRLGAAAFAGLPQGP